MWFTVVTARRFIFLSFQPRLAAALLRSCSVVNSPTRRAGLSPAFQPASLAQRFTWFDRELVAAGTPGRYIRPKTGGLEMPEVHFWFYPWTVAGREG